MIDTRKHISDFKITVAVAELLLPTSLGPDQSSCICFTMQNERFGKTMLEVLGVFVDYLLQVNIVKLSNEPNFLS